MRNHVINYLTSIAGTDSRIMLVVGDVGFNVVEGFQSKFPDRFINAGIAEQNMTSVAAGLALEGNMVFTYSIGNFPTLRCIEQIRNDVCYHNASVKILAVGGGFAYGDLGMSHHATEDIAMMRSLPNMTVYVPSDEVDAVLCLKDAISFDGPAYIRMARGREKVFHEHNDFSICELDKIKDKGSTVNILTTGTVLNEGIKLQDMLKSQNVSCGCYSVPKIKPIDKEAIVEIASTSKMIISIEEHNIIGGLGSAIAEVLSDIRDKHAFLLRFGLRDEYTSIVGNQDYLRDQYEISANKIFPKIIELLSDAIFS